MDKAGIDKAFLEAWLHLQCQLIPEVRRAFVQVDSARSAGEVLQAAWPKSGILTDTIGELLSLTRRSGNRVVSQGEVKKVAGSDTVGQIGDAGVLLAYPLALGEEIRAALVLELPGALQHQQAAIGRLVDWGNAWLNFARSAAKTDSAGIGFDGLVHSMIDRPSLQEAAMAAVGWLAHHFDCQRVSLSVSDGRRFRLSASSDAAIVAARTDLALRLEQAVEAAFVEARAQAEPSAATRSAEPDRPDNTGLAPQALYDSGEGSLFNALLSIDGQIFAGVSFEPNPGATLDTDRQREIAELLPLLGGLLGLRWQREQSLVGRARRALSQTADRVRAVALSAILVTLALWLYADTGYRVGGNAVVEGEVQQALIAPFDGYVARAEARAGERVRESQVLAELDDRELRLQRRLRQGDQVELQKEYRKALAAMDHSEARILDAQITQAGAEIELLDRQLARTRLRAPFDGVVVSGDLSRSLGKPVERGEVLFEVAPLDSYRVAIEIRDQDISAIEVGKRGALVLAAMPTEHLPLEVVNVTHFSTGDGESAHFRVEARLLEAPGSSASPVAGRMLRPGMRGLAKIDIDRRARLWVWSHQLIDWLRLQLWTWMP
jgi:multidrug resistance efflux pump